MSPLHVYYTELLINFKYLTFNYIYLDQKSGPIYTRKHFHYFFLKLKQLQCADLC